MTPSTGEPSAWQRKLFRGNNPQWRIVVPPSSLLFCETAFLNRIGLSAGRVTLNYALAQTAVVAQIVDKSVREIESCAGVADYLLLIAERTRNAAFVDQRLVKRSWSKGRMWALHKADESFKFVAIRIPKTHMPLLRGIAATIGCDASSALILLLSDSFYGKRRRRPLIHNARRTESHTQEARTL